MTFIHSCARVNVKKVSLELGGKSPLIIFSDCDLDKAVRMVGTHVLLSAHKLIIMCIVTVRGKCINTHLQFRSLLRKKSLTAYTTK